MKAKGNEALRRTASPLQRAVWCGTVSSLAVVLFVLNFFPIAIDYQIDAQVVTVPERLVQLKRHAQTSEPIQPPADSSAVAGPQLLNVHELDQQAIGTKLPKAADGEPMAIASIRTLWPERTTTAKLRQWLKSVTSSQNAAGGSGQLTAEGRFARWELETTEHYLKHANRFANDGSESNLRNIAASSSPSVPASLTTTSAKAGSAARLASLESDHAHDTDSDHDSTDADADQPSRSDDPSTENEPALIAHNSYQPARPHAEIVAELEQQMALARRTVEASLPVTSREVEPPAAAPLGISGSPKVRPHTAAVPSSTILGILVLAVAVGAITGWSVHRAESGGVYSPQDVARELQLDGLPLLGAMTVPMQLSAGDWLEKTTARADALRRRVVQKATLLSETIVLFWCTALVVRGALDPLWRMLLLENPLAALSRLIIGLP